MLRLARAVQDEEIRARLVDLSRLHAVRATGLLDTAPEEPFDRLTRVAACALGVPVVFMSLVERNRDFHKSQWGFGEPLATTRELRGRTFCHHVVASGKAVVLNDVTRHDEGFRDVPTVRSLGIRAYVGIPMFSMDGEVIGGLCAVDFRPMDWAAVQIQQLADVAGALTHEIEQRQELSEARRAARSAMQTLAHSAHDLRGPITIITMSAPLLRLDVFRGTRDLVGDIEAAAARLDEMVTKLLPPPDSMGPSTRELDAAEILAEAAAEAEPLALRTGVRLECAANRTSALVLADDVDLKRVLSNLINNAIKFSGPSGTVRLSTVPPALGSTTTLATRCSRRAGRSMQRIPVGTVWVYPSRRSSSRSTGARSA